VLDTLRELRLQGQTLVIFSSDNGPWLTQGTNGGVAGPLRGGKGGTFEGGMREPTIAWWPGQVPAGSACDAIAGNIDLLPTFVSLAGGTLPQDRKIDGRDISSLLLGQSRQSPRDAHYYFAGNTLQAVRSGRWKLAITRQSEGRRAAAVTNATEPFKPALYDLDTEISERTDVAAAHPEVVERLQSLILKMDADLGASHIGPGVREPGRVARPVGLWLPGHEPKPSTEDSPGLANLKPGDSLGRDDAPDLAGKPLTIKCEVEARSSNGVIVAHGGAMFGYAVYLRDGKLKFTVREGGKPVSIATTDAPPSAFVLEARLARDGVMTLTVDGRTAAEGKAPGPISRQPSEDFCLGHDNRAAVGDYVAPAPLTGTIRRLNILND
jgi:hypothetical protein